MFFRNSIATTLLLLLVVLTGCSRSHSSSAQIEWVNFIKVQGITYYMSLVGANTLPPSLLGSTYATVRFQVADHVSDPAYQLKDGDAAFLPIGTPLYQVVGYRATFRLAALWNGHLAVYEASVVPHAQTGADLLDIRDRVASIGVLWNSDTPPGTQEHGSITAPAVVQALVTDVLAAPLRSNTTTNPGTQVFIAFHLRDGTETVRVCYPAEHDLAGIQVPDSFVQALQPLLPAATPTGTRS